MRRGGYTVALAGISAAMASVFLIGAMFIPFGKLALYTMAGLAVSLPLTKGLIFGGVAAYAVAALIGFFVSNIKAFPFILFFGLFALVAYLCDFRLYRAEKLPKWLRIALIVLIKIAFFCGAFFGCYKLMGLVVGDIRLGDYAFTLPVLTAVAFVIYSLYDVMYRFVFRVMTDKVSRIVK